MLTDEFRDFYHNWRTKADGYVDDGGTQWAFDRFFTLYVVYNRLYAELTFWMARAGEVNLEQRREENRGFPDADAAKNYARFYIGCRRLMALLDGNPATAGAMREATALLAGPVNGQQFYINLNMLNGERQQDKDQEHLAKFQSNNANDRAEAVLQFIYAVRCNLFHGHKGFEAVQLDVLRPANILLLRMTEILFERLNQ